MGVKDRFRRAITRSDRSSSSSNSSSQNNTPIPSHPTTGTSTPIPESATPTSATPSIILTKTTTSSSRLSLSKTLTWGRRLTPEERERKRIEEWRKHDEKAWDEPRSGARHSGKKSKAHQDMLRAFEWRLRERGSLDGRSMFSGISPGQSRVGSVDDGRSPRGSLAGVRKRSGAMGMLSREVSREEVEVVPPHGVGVVAEE